MNFATYRQLAHGPKEGKMAGDALYRFERAVSVRISWALFRLFPDIRATQVTAVSYVCLAAVFGIAAALLYGAVAPMWGALAGLGLLYVVNIFDKVDGEIARASDYCTQRGVYYDRTAHAIYPTAFYLLAGTYFLVLTGNYALFVLTMLLSVLTQQFLFFREARLLVGDQIKGGRMALKDLLERHPDKRPRPSFPVRLADYLTFLIYDHTLFFYAALAVLAVVSLPIAEVVYAVHVTVSLLVNGYKVLLQYPRDRLYTKEEAQNLR